MSQENMLSRSPGIRVSADGTRIGAVYGIGCPALEAEGLDTTPLNSAWRTQRPSGKRAGDLTLTMLLKRGDAGQAAMIEKYLSSQEISIILTLPGGQALAWTGWVRRLALNAPKPGAPVSLEAVVCVSGGTAVSA